jgi:hypothetical protein
VSQLAQHDPDWLLTRDSNGGAQRGCCLVCSKPAMEETRHERVLTGMYSSHLLVLGTGISPSVAGRKVVYRIDGCASLEA